MLFRSRQERAEARIARGTSKEIEQSLKVKVRPTAQVDEIQVAPFMIVQLNDGSGGSVFQITPLTQDKQSVAGEGSTTWAWSVVPLKSGQQVLYLSVGTRFKLPNKEEETRFTPLYEKEISIEVDHVYETKRFVFGNWQWLTATLIIPLVGYLWHSWKPKSKSTELLP